MEGSVDRAPRCNHHTPSHVANGERMRNEMGQEGWVSLATKEAKAF